jgi:hypothetical protein
MAWLAALEIRQRLLILLIALDHLALAIITLGNCARGETISASAWRQEQAGKLQGRLARPVIDWFFRVVEKDHCQVSWQAEKHMYRRPSNG